MSLRERIAASLTVGPRSAVNTAPDVNPRARRKAMLGLVVLVVVIGFFVLRASVAAEELVIHWQPLSWGSLALSLLMVLASYFLVSMLWWYILRLLGGQVTPRQAMRAYFLSGLPRYIPGWIWGYAGRTYLIEQVGVRRKVAALSSVVEVGVFVGTGLAIGVFYWLKAPEAVAACMIISCLVVIGITLSPLSVDPRHRITIRSIFASIATILLYLGFWIFYGLSVAILTGAVMTGLGIGETVTITSGFALAWLAGFIAVFVPGGLGIREAGVVLVLEPIIGSASAILISILSRVMNLTADAVLFIFALAQSVSSAKRTGQGEHNV